MLGLLHSSRPNPPRCPIQMPPPPGDNHCKLKGLRVLLTPIREKDLGGTFIGPELQPVAATGTRTEVLVPGSLGRLAVLAGMFSDCKHSPSNPRAEFSTATLETFCTG